MQIQFQRVLFRILTRRSVRAETPLVKSANVTIIATDNSPSEIPKEFIGQTIEGSTLSGVQAIEDVDLNDDCKTLETVIVGERLNLFGRNFADVPQEREVFQKLANPLLVEEMAGGSSLNEIVEPERCGETSLEKDGVFNEDVDIENSSNHGGDITVAGGLPLEGDCSTKEANKLIREELVGPICSYGLNGYDGLSPNMGLTKGN
ncbi:hypothetical protein COLO4_33649 [Corchorus olitorius]|uniref:Uncharacterized protein n=1 Tax=Corchorus olitorius TaxID=93759 RepID=A0A1R3GSC8_9ROSI|nr:hypothetical protein COLO4_33649 [Corchorus olitorius]